MTQKKEEETSIIKKQTLIQQTTSDAKFIRLLFVSEWQSILTKRMQNLKETRADELIQFISEQIVKQFPITPVYVMYNIETKHVVISKTQEKQNKIKLKRRQFKQKKRKSNGGNSDGCSFTHQNVKTSSKNELICVILLGPQTKLNLTEIKNECRRQQKKLQESVEAIVRLGEKNNCILWLSSLIARQINVKAK